jgi:SprT protein
MPSTWKRRLSAAIQREFDFAATPPPGIRQRIAAPEPRSLAPEPQDQELTASARALLESIGENQLAQNIRVRWNSRLRSTAGRAYRARHLVELNPALLRVPEDEIDRTLRHELAHLVAYRQARKRSIAPHGPEWRAACNALGIPGEDRCHALDFPRSRQRRHFAYVCSHCGREIHRVRRIRVQVACFHCCKRYNQGRFSVAFALHERQLEPDEESP